MSSTAASNELSEQTWVASEGLEHIVGATNKGHPGPDRLSDIGWQLIGRQWRQPRFIDAHSSRLPTARQTSCDHGNGDGMSPRQRHLLPEEFDEQQQALYDAILTGPRGAGGNAKFLTHRDGAMRGPFNAMLLMPGLGQHLQALGAALRYEGVVSDRVREMTVLVVAAAFQCEFEQKAHEPIARSLGVTDAEIDAIRAQTEINLTDPNERIALQVAATLVRERRVDDDLYHAAAAALGDAALFNITTLVGYYSTLAMQLAFFGVS
jgi:4-carboxymuconolactone decarboxylase